MKKLLAIGIILVMVGGCATLKSACEHGDAIKARIRAALQVAQVGYPLVVQLAGATANPDVHYKIGLVDAALDLLGTLAYDLVCPGLAELNESETALQEVQDVKADLGVK